MNDLVDRDLDRAAGRGAKPLVRGDLALADGMAVAGIGLAIQVAASVVLGPLPLLLGLAAAGSALAYNVWLARTPLSVLPYIVSFGLLPLWVATGIGVPLDRVAAAPLLVAPFAAAAHLANAVRDFHTDQATGSRNLAQVLGERRAFLLAWAVAMAVGLGVGVSFVGDGRLDVPGIGLGLAGLAAVAQGLTGPQRLWIGMLVAAVMWTAGWALGSG